RRLGDPPGGDVDRAGEELALRRGSRQAWCRSLTLLRESGISVDMRCPMREAPSLRCSCATRRHTPPKPSPAVQARWPPGELRAPLFVSGLNPMTAHHPA